MSVTRTLRRPPTIRSRLAWLVLACVVPAWLTAAGLIAYDYQRERVRLVRDSIATARALVHAVDRQLVSITLAAEVLSTSPSLQTTDLAAFQEQARDIASKKVGSNVVLSDASGRQLVNTLRKPGEPLPMHGNPVQLRAVFESGRSVISDLYVGGLLQRPVMSVDVPVYRDGKVVYDLSIGELPDRFIALLNEQRLPPGWIGALFDTSGTIVARTHEMDRFVGKKGAPALVKRMSEVAEDSLETLTVEGIPVISVFSRSSISNWTVAIGIPTRSLTSNLLQSVGRLVAVAVLLLAGGLSLAWVIGGRIAGSIHALTGPALALGKGEIVTFPPLHLKEADEVADALVATSMKLVQTQHQVLAAGAQAAHNEQLFRATIESAPIAMVMIDAEGSIVLVNAQTEDLFGYTREQLLGQPVERLIPERFRATHPGLRGGFLAASRPRRMGAGRDLYALRKDGGEVPVEIGLSPVQTDEGPLVIGAIFDISERKRHAEALERSNIELQRFAYVASHDLQTPMRSVASFAELLRSTYADKLDAQAIDWIRRMVESIKHLQALVRDLLEYSQVDSQAHPFEAINFREVFEQAVSLLDASVFEAGAEVTCGDLPVVMGDRSQLVQVMLNLIGNGLKYRGPNPARVHVSAERQRDGWRFAVRDNGIGIALRHQERIFEIFERLHGQTEYPGTGIGLAVCRRVVHRHGGRIWVESEPGAGSVFYFTIAEGAKPIP